MIRGAYYRFRGWLRRVRNPPAVVIAYYGQRTPRPQVHVSVQGAHGLLGVYTFDADLVGEAKATMYGTSLAHIMQRRLVDERKLNPLSKPHNLPPYQPPHENMICTAVQELHYNKWEREDDAN